MIEVICYESQDNKYKKIFSRITEHLRQSRDLIIGVFRTLLLRGRRQRGKTHLLEGVHEAIGTVIASPALSALWPHA